MLVVCRALQQSAKGGGTKGGPSGKTPTPKTTAGAQGKFTRAGSVLGRQTEDVNDHYTFHEVGLGSCRSRCDSRFPHISHTHIPPTPTLFSLAPSRAP